MKDMRFEHMRDQMDAKSVESMIKHLETTGCYDIGTEFEFDEEGNIKKKLFCGKNKDGEVFAFTIRITPLEPWDGDEGEEWKR